MEKHCSLVLDEMTIGPGEEYIPQLDKVVGKSTWLATKMQGYILVGLNTYYKIPVAYFLVNQPTAKEQEALTVQVIKDVEGCGCGFKIEGLVTDNLAVYANMFKRMNGGTLHHVIRHPVQQYNEEEISSIPLVYRPLFLSFDYSPVQNNPALPYPKNVRNQLLERKLEIKGKPITGQLVVRLFEEKTGELLTPVRNWTPKHVMPNSIEKQKVKVAMDLFRPSVTTAIQISLKKHLRYRLPDKMPYYILDERLHFLEWDFNPKLHEWHREVDDIVKRMPDGTKEEEDAIKEAKKKFLTHETYEALTFTTSSTVACIRHLLQKLGFKYVLTRRFSSDPVKQLFGAIRQMMVSNFKGDATAVSQAFEKILRTEIAYNSIYGNTTLSRESEKEYELIRNSEKCKIKMTKALTLLPESNFIMLNEIYKAPVRPKTSSQSCTVAFLAGYVVRVLTEQEFCEDCIARLQGVKCTDPLMQLIYHLGKTYQQLV
ncbi:hypothetical protein GHT06_018390 [Daphnia sinensis]|uniref:Transposable element P transposase-like RNase H domain-containing protein n=1 Tax=Daphnia sinensis TaxID=1820382 RepID=A0AAD5LDU6_9CRUS|nr:hypothetical protein GHT06_018390 [Daphnia sinensis]